VPTAVLIVSFIVLVFVLRPLCIWKKHQNQAKAWVFASLHRFWMAKDWSCAIIQVQSQIEIMMVIIAYNLVRGLAIPSS
jgi:hypothetical protein